MGGDVPTATPAAARPAQRPRVLNRTDKRTQPTARLVHRGAVPGA